MNHDDHLESTLRRSLDEHARQLGEPDIGMDAVWMRVDRRQRRRRSIALVGSMAAVGAGVVGIAALGREAAEPGAARQRVSPSVVETPGPATSVPESLPGQTYVDYWRCVGELGSDGEFRLFEFCEPVVQGWPATLPPPPENTVATWVPVADTAVPSFPVGTTAPPAPMPPPVTSPVMQTHVIVVGDSLSSIAEQYAMPIEAIINFNGWTDGFDHQIFPGDVVLIPPYCSRCVSTPTTGAP